MQTEILWIAPTGALLLGYLFGSIPFGLILTRAAGAGDLRAIGSGNIGATNVLRTGRKGIAAATLLLDLAKGWAAVMLVGLLFPGNELLAGAAAFLGHCYPIWLKFRGGKGVAIFMGIALALLWPCALIYAALWIALLAVVRISSLAGIIAAISTPVSAAWFGRFDLVLLFLALALLTIWKHRSNIDRMMTGDEPRVGGSKA